mmetsp:Transcript_42895/g.68986  ORF Transcript_42895/g.68986 Transcript_42895/m.68986 type:complete len:226 (-) Transcript_42895:2097-2774(-)
MAPMMTPTMLCCVASATVANMDRSPHSATNIIVNVCQTAPHHVRTFPSVSSLCLSVSSASIRSPCVGVPSPPSRLRISASFASFLCSAYASSSSCVPKMPNKIVAHTSITPTDDSSKSALDATRKPTRAELAVMMNSAPIVPKNTASLPCRMASNIARKNVLSPTSVQKTTTKLAGTPLSSQSFSSTLCFSESSASYIGGRCTASEGSMASAHACPLLRLSFATA